MGKPVRKAKFCGKILRFTGITTKIAGKVGFFVGRTDKMYWKGGVNRWKRCSQDWK